MMDGVVLPSGLTRLSSGANCCLGSDPSVGREIDFGTPLVGLTS